MITRVPFQLPSVSTWRSFYRQTHLDPSPNRSAVKAVKNSRSIESVLDLGCANCNEARYFLDQGAGRVIGIDSCPLAVEPARRIEARYGHRFQFKNSDFRGYDFGQNRFDLVFANNSLPYASFAEIGEALGQIVPSLRDEVVFVGTFFGKLHWARQTDPELTFVSQAELATMFFGLDVVIEKEERIEPEGFKQKFIVIARRSDQSL